MRRICRHATPFAGATWVAPDELKAALNARYPRGGALDALRWDHWMGWARSVRDELYHEFPPYQFAWTALHEWQERHPKLRCENWESRYTVGSADEDLSHLLDRDPDGE